MKWEEIKELEPLVKGIEAIYVSGTGIVDYKKVTEKLGELFQKEGGEIEAEPNEFSHLQGKDTVDMK